MESKIEILVVDDSRTQAELLKYLLELNGYSTRVASDGRQALETAKAHRPALIISDIVMPGMDGYEMCSRLKEDEELCSIPVILLTQLSEPEDIVRGLRARADYYLTKPYKPEYLLSKVKAVLEAPPVQKVAAGPMTNGNHGENGTLAHSEDEDALQVVLGGKSYVVHADRQQMLNLLFSTYENAVEQNRELAGAQLELEATNERLREQMSLLTEAREELERQQEQLLEANAKLEALATSDGLTGLKNHRAFKERLEEEIRRAARYGTPLSLFLLDVDKFKEYNDSFGHPAGDEVLRLLGGVLQEVARTSDMAARYGGEEFAVLLPNAPADMAQAVAERFRASIEESLWPFRPVTASFGVSTFIAVGHDINPRNAGDRLLELADKALYLSKAGGRNRVSFVD
jgi:diguanylate cyclase (GGDEF)-like protein